MQTTANKPRFKLTAAAVSTFLLAIAFVWYLGAFNSLTKPFQDTREGSLLVGILAGISFLAFLCCAFLGTVILKFYNKRRNLLKLWLIAGIFISILLIPFKFEDFSVIIVLSGLAGAYFGLGMPTFMGYFAANTESNNRGKFGGIVVLLIVLFFALYTVISEVTGALLVTTTLIIWLAVGLLFLFGFNPPEKEALAKNEVSFRSIISNKTFILYFVPWLMFSLINALTLTVNDGYFKSILNLSNHTGIENIIAGVSAVFIGFLVDKQGRKRLALIGFALLGSGYAALGLFSGELAAAWFYIIADGIAWGSFTALFLMTIWGDIAQGRNSEKYYILGVLPYLISTFAGETIGKLIESIIGSQEVLIFSFAAFFLFIATLPLAYAPETLPEKVMKDRDLKSYIENAKKKATKDAEKARKNALHENIEDSSKEDDEEYKKAKELAEKYY